MGVAHPAHPAAGACGAGRVAGPCGGGGRCGLENVVGLAALINPANRFWVIDFPRPFPVALHGFSTGHGPLAPPWRVSVEIPRLSLFLLDDGGGLRSSV